MAKPGCAHFIDRRVLKKVWFVGMVQSVIEVLYVTARHMMCIALANTMLIADISIASVTVFTVLPLVVVLEQCLCDISMFIQRTAEACAVMRRIQVTDVEHDPPCAVAGVKAEALMYGGEGGFLFSSFAATSMHSCSF